jgi:dTDP-glucose 4,6-dehydratase
MPTLLMLLADLLGGFGEFGHHGRASNHRNAALRMILDRGRIGEKYMIGRRRRSNKQIVELVLELMGQPVDGYEYVPDRPGHDLRYANDSSKLRTELGWAPRYGDFRAGLADTIDWYRENEWWWKPKKAATEARYRELGR